MANLFTPLIIVSYLLFGIFATQESWVWQQVTYLDDKQLTSGYLQTVTVDSVRICAVECLMVSECQSFFLVTLTSGQFDCFLHNKRFSTWEVDMFAVTQPNCTHYQVITGCPNSAMYTFSREANMCIRLEILTASDAITAQSECVGNSERLVVIDSDVKKQSIVQALQASSGYNREYHVGASRTNTTPPYYVWDNGEPVASDFFSPSDPLDKDCVFVSLNTTNTMILEGHTTDCSSLKRHICELVLTD